MTINDPTPRARNTDPATSHMAADSMKETAKSQRVRILEALREYGPLSADELDRKLHLRPTSAGRRLSELRGKGARQTNITDLTRSGRKAYLWVFSKTDFEKDGGQP